MKNYYAIKSDSKYFCGWNKRSVKILNQPDKNFIYDEKTTAESWLSSELYTAERDKDPKDLKFWRSAKVVKLSLIEA